MGYYLLDHRNPNGDHFYASRQLKLTAIVMHITAGLEDLDTVDDQSAERTAAYAASTDRQVSWHSGSDADSLLYLLPANYTAWHASNYNSSTYGHEISKRHTDWRTMSDEWVRKTLLNAARCLAPIVKQYGIPIRKATRFEVDRARATGVPCGFISHAELQPEDRTDPGWVRGVDTFPWTRFFGYLQQYVSGQVPDEEEEEMGFSFAQVGLPATNATDFTEREVLFPDLGGAMQVTDRWVKIHGPGQPFIDSTQVARRKATLRLSHFLDDAGVKVGAYADDELVLEHHETGPSVQVPANASKLVVQYSSVTGLNAMVQVKSA